MSDKSDAGDPKWIDKYKIVARLGKGGSSLVYLARHVYLQRSYAIKLFNPRPASSQEEKDSDEALSLLDKMLFLSEASSLDKLQGPNILPVIDVGFYGNQPYIVTEYMEKGSLRNLRLKRPPIETSLTILSNVGQALTAIHKRKIVHGDLKPENIFFNETDEALLGDFGNATDLGEKEVVSTPEIKGTYAYMAPEQFRGEICKKSDQYALGCIAYELFTGQHPFTTSGFEAWDRQTWQKKHESEPPRPLREIVPDLKANIEVATLTALAKEPDHRHADIDRFVQGLYTTTDSARLVRASLIPQSPREVETAPPVFKNAAIDTATPTTFQQSNAIINNAPATTPSTSTTTSQTQVRPPSLYELQLPESFICLLMPDLEKVYGLSIANASALRPNKPKPYTYTQLLRNKEPLCNLLYIRDKFLTNEYIDNLIVMLEAFEPDPFLVIFLDTRLPSLQLRNLLKSERKGSIDYITKSDLEELSSQSESEIERARILANALQVEAAPSETKEMLPPDHLEPTDAHELERILSNYAQTKDYSRFWPQVFDADGLRNRKGHFKFDNESDIVAGDIVKGLMSLSLNVKNEKRDALGLLLTRLLKYPDFPQDDRPKILAIIDTYRLVPQDEYNKLKGDNR